VDVDVDNGGIAQGADALMSPAWRVGGNGGIHTVITEK
jgi:hypothetical protein